MWALVFVYIIEEVAHDHAQNAPLVKNWARSCVHAASARYAGCESIDQHICFKCFLDARFRNPPIGGFKHVECLCGTPGIVSLLKTWFFQLCMIASTLFWSNSMDTFNGLIVLRIHF